MRKTSDDPAFPFEGGQNSGMQPYVGLTKRELIAKDILCASLSGWGFQLPLGSPEHIRDAIALADMLLNELDANNSYEVQS